MLAEIFLSIGKMHLGFVFFFFNLAGTLLLSYFRARNAAEELSGLKAGTGINNEPLCQYLGLQINLIKS